MTRIYVGKLSHRCSERDLRRFLDAYGKIKEILMKNGFAFVDFEDYKDADDAVYDLNGKDLNGDRIIVEHAKGKERGGGGQFLDGSRDYGLDRNGGGRGGRYGGGGGGRYGDDRGGARSQNRYGPPMRTKWTVRVENLSSRVSWQDLKDMCRKYGEVTYADAHRMETNVATVCFQTEEDMRAVIRKMDGKDLNGRKVEFIEQVEKSRSRSRSRGARSRSRTPPRKRSRTRSRTPLRRSNSPASRTPSRSPRGRSPSPRRSRSRSGSRN